MRNIFKIYAFVFMVCFYEVSCSLEKIDISRDWNGMKRRSIIERRDDNDNDNTGDNKRDNLNEILNVMEKEDEVERELEILKHWQALSALKNRKEETDSVEDKGLGRDGLNLFKKTSKRHFRASERHRYPWWWSCPDCDKSKVFDCKCPLKNPST